MARLVTRRDHASGDPAWTAMGAVSYLFIHHFVSALYATLDPATVRFLERQAMAAQPGLVAGPYPRIFASDGSIGEFRPWGVRGGATLNFNDKSCAFCGLGNFEHHDVPEAMVVSMAGEAAWGMHNGFLVPNFATLSHSVVYPTACCGRNLKPRAGDGFGQIGALARYFAQRGIFGGLAALGAAPSSPPAETVEPVPAPAPVDWKALDRYLTAVAIDELRSQGGVAYTASPEAARTYRREVEWWQHALNLGVKARLEADGKFGIATLAKTIDFQRFFGVRDQLYGHGIVGHETRAAMIDVLKAK